MKPDEFTSACRSRLMTTRAHAFLIDAPTSRASAYTQYLNLVGGAVDVLSSAIILVMCGSRIDLVHHTRQVMRKMWPRARPWVIQLTAGDVQTWSRKPGFLLVLELEHGKPPSTKSSEMPHTLAILKCFPVCKLFLALLC